MQTDEEFFVCKWTVDEASGAPLLLLAGKNSVLRVLDVMQEKLLWVCDCCPDPALKPQTSPHCVFIPSKCRADHGTRRIEFGWVSVQSSLAVLNGAQSYRECFRCELLSS
jgi:hypothetical protein